MISTQEIPAWVHRVAWEAAEEWWEDGDTHTITGTEVLGVLRGVEGETIYIVKITGIADDWHGQPYQTAWELSITRKPDGKLALDEVSDEQLALVEGGSKG